MKLKNYIKKLDLISLLKTSIFFIFFGSMIYLYDSILICRLFTWLFNSLLVFYIFTLIFEKKSIVLENDNRSPNPVMNGLNELIFLIFISFLSYTKSWITLILFIIGIFLTAIIVSYNSLKKD